MLRPYLAIIRDSFRAAMSARVLYFVMALIVLVLIVIAPLHVREQVDWKLSVQQHVSNPTRLATRLIEDGRSGRRAATARLWERLSDPLKEDLVEFVEAQSDESGPPAVGEPQTLGVAQTLVDELNTILSQRDFFDEQAFKGRRLPEEARTLIDSGIEDLPEIKVKRLNRLLLDAALRRDIVRAGTTQLEVYYLNWHWSAFTTNVSHSEFAHGLSNQLPVYFDKFVMSIGIFIAILVTSSIIPEMLEAGSLNLLLSKPITRWGLLFTKFFGGCAFILLCATVFFTGIWLWMGIQLNVWELSVLLSIPVYVLVFAMYYSVSVLAGIWFRSPILCVTFALLFWAACFVIGVANNWLDNRQYNLGPMQVVSYGGDQLAYVDVLQHNYRWDRDQWKSVMQREQSPQDQGFAIAAFFDRLDNFPDYPGPVYDDENEQLFAGSSDLQQAVISARYNLLASSANDNWSTLKKGNLPSGTIALFYSDKLGLLAFDDGAKIFSVSVESGSKEKSLDTENADSGNQGEKDKKARSQKPKSKFELVSENDAFDVQSASSVSHNPSNDEIAFYSRENLVILSANDQGKYDIRITEEIENLNNRKMTAFVEYRGDQLFVALGNGRIYHFTAGSDKLVTVHTATPNNRVAIRSTAASPDGRWFAVTYRDGRVWIYDAKDATDQNQPWIPAQGDIMATTFDDDNRIWIADRFKGAQNLVVESGTTERSYQPTSDWLTSAFRYAIRPLYRIFPKPGEFYKVIAELSSSGNTEFNPDVDLTKMPYRDNPWSPLRNGIIFMFGMLVIACLVFQRQDF